MASTTFTDNQTVIYAAWLNDVNNAVYNGVFQSTTLTATNMVCNGTASGAGFTALVSNTFSAPSPIGSATPNTGAFTTLSASSLTLSTKLAVAQGGTGLATLTANNVILGNGTSTPSFVAPSTTGNVLTSNGTTWVSLKPGLGISGETWHNVMSSPGRTSGTTYTAPAYSIMVTVGGQAVSGSPTITVVVGGVTINTWSFPYGTGQPITFIVPASATYVVTFSAGCTMNYWNELY